MLTFSPNVALFKMRRRYCVIPSILLLRRFLRKTGALELDESENFEISKIIRQVLSVDESGEWKRF